MMKFISTCIILFSALLSTNVFSGSYSSDIKQAMRECRIERNQFKNRGTHVYPPSCQRVEQLIRLQRLETEAETSGKTGQQMPSHININTR